VFVLRGELLDLLRRRADLRRLECVLVFHRDGKPLGDFRKTWRTACAAAGVRAVFHDMCRSAIRNMIRAGVPERVAMAAAGRRTRSILDRYNIVSEADLAAAAESIDTYVAEKRTAQPRVRALTGTGTSGAS
jgi:hypothetical protein